VSAELHVSVDLDGVHHHLRGYGVDPEVPEYSVVYERALPRMLDAFAKAGVNATLFSIAEDAPANAAALRRADEAGHEVASHSLSHPTPFDALPPDALMREVESSKALLEEAVGRSVVGFRAPGWGVSPAVLDAVERAGYAYDSSIFPSPAYFAALLSMKRRLGGAMQLRPVAALRWALGRRAPHRRGRLWEVPVTVTPWLRVPYYHTLDAVLGEPTFARLSRRVAASSGAINYALHAIDFLAPEEVEARLPQHPGGAWPLDQKLERVARNLARLLATHRPVQLRERFAEEAE
jgi:peptidoglycan/xylan/chitin deacetylase (PgdA/CDA1 family)